MCDVLGRIVYLPLLSTMAFTIAHYFLETTSLLGIFRVQVTTSATTNPSVSTMNTFVIECITVPERTTKYTVIFDVQKVVNVKAMLLLAHK